MKNIILTNISPRDFLNTTPVSGGESRRFYLFRYLPDYYKTLFIDFGWENTKQHITGNLIRYIAGRPRWHYKLERLLEVVNKNGGSAYLAASLAGRICTSYKTLIAQAVAKSSVIIADSPYLFSSIKKYRKKLLIYNSHNVEYELYKNSSSSLVRRVVQFYIYLLERSACQHAHAVLSCSEEDKKKFCLLYKIPKEKVYVIPNGVDVSNVKPSKPLEKVVYKQELGLSGKKIILFIGSNHEPNREAVDYIIYQLAQRFPKYIFIIAGGSTEHCFQERYFSWRDAKFISDKIPSEGKKVFGYGWHQLEYWPGTILVRWTRPNFGIHIDEKIQAIYFKAYSTRRNSAEVFFDERYRGIIDVSRKWQRYEFFLEKGTLCDIRIKMQRKWSAVGDSRELGMAISEIGYRADGKEYAINLEDIMNPAFYFAPNVLVTGQITDPEKKNLLGASDIAINPMLRGSGTNLKMFEYMAAGLPVVTTPFGARGIEGNHKEHFMVSTIEDFPNNIAYLLGDENTDIYKSIKAGARTLVEEKYDWKIIAHHLSEVIEEQLSLYNEKSYEA